MMSICNTQKMQQHSNKQGDTVTEKKTSTSYFGSGNLNFWQTGKVYITIYIFASLQYMLC